MATTLRDDWPRRVLDAVPGPLPDDDSALVPALARALHVRVADLGVASPAARALLPERWARHFRVVPLDATDDEIVLATADPLDLESERALAFATGRRVRFALGAPSAVL